MIKTASQPKPKVDAGAEAWKAQAKSVIGKAAQQAAEEQAKKNEDRRQQHLVQAATEYMKKTYAPKAKGPAPAMKLPKTCRCHLTCAEGVHRETCAFNPLQLASAIRVHGTTRASLQEQFEKTSMTAAQGKGR